MASFLTFRNSPETVPEINENSPETVLKPAKTVRHKGNRTEIVNFPGKSARKKRNKDLEIRTGIINRAVPDLRYVTMMKHFSCTKDRLLPILKALKKEGEVKQDPKSKRWYYTETFKKSKAN